MKRSLSLLFGVIVAGAFVSACTTRVADPSSVNTSSVVFAMDFTKCGAIECARISVPSDYANEASSTLELAIYRRQGAASDASQHPLFVHPGGPGADVRQVVEQFATLFPNEAEQFDVIGLSTRASQDGTGAECGANLDDVVLAKYDESAAARFANRCKTRSDQLVGRVGTRDSVEDVNRVRQLLGYEKISFIGWSYGATLGAALVMQYPQTISAAVLDAPADPTVSWSKEFSVQQPNQIRALQNQVKENELEKLTTLQNQLDGLANSAVSGTTLAVALELRLYDKTAGEFVSALFENEVTSTSTIETTADNRMGRDADGTDDGGIETQILVRCSDISRTDAKATVKAQLPRLNNKLHIGIGAAIERICTHFNESPRPLRSLSVSKYATKANVLVVATSDDPVMPSSFSTEMAQRMKWGSHTVNDARHLAVGFNSSATDMAVRCLLNKECFG